LEPSETALDSLRARVVQDGSVEDLAYLLRACRSRVHEQVTNLTEHGSKLSGHEETLSAPITCRLSDGTETELHDVGAVTVSARRLKYLTVSYMDASEKDSVK